MNKQLKFWLQLRNARLMWRQDVVGDIECYRINGRACIVQLFDEGRRFEIFVPAAPLSNSITDTFQAADRALGFDSAGIVSDPQEDLHADDDDPKMA